jgi:hypothetical protein
MASMKYLNLQLSPDSSPDTVLESEEEKEAVKERPKIPTERHQLTSQYLPSQPMSQSQYQTFSQTQYGQFEKNDFKAIYEETQVDDERETYTQRFTQATQFSPQHTQTQLSSDDEAENADMALAANVEIGEINKAYAKMKRDTLLFPLDKNSKKQVMKDFSDLLDEARFTKWEVEHFDTDIVLHIDCKVSIHPRSDDPNLPENCDMYFDTWFDERSWSSTHYKLDDVAKGDFLKNLKGKMKKVRLPVVPKLLYAVFKTSMDHDFSGDPEVQRQEEGHFRFWMGGVYEAPDMYRGVTAENLFHDKDFIPAVDETDDPIESPVVADKSGKEELSDDDDDDIVEFLSSQEHSDEEPPPFKPPTRPAFILPPKKRPLPPPKKRPLPPPKSSSSSSTVHGPAGNREEISIEDDVNDWISSRTKRPEEKKSIMHHLDDEQRKLDSLKAAMAANRAKKAEHIMFNLDTVATDLYFQPGPDGWFTLTFLTLPNMRLQKKSTNLSRRAAKAAVMKKYSDVREVLYDNYNEKRARKIQKPAGNDYYIDAKHYNALMKVPQSKKMVNQWKKIIYETWYAHLIPRPREDAEGWIET